MISFSKIMHKLLVERTSFKNLLRGSEPGRVDRGNHDVNARSIRVQSMDGQEAWTFNYKSNPSTTGQRWHGYVRFFKHDVSSKDNAMDLDCKVSCDCPDYTFRYAYNNAKSDVGDLGRNNGRPPRSRAEGGVGDYGIGMCVSEGEIVSTDRGLLPIEMISKNDKVWTLDGWRQVTNHGMTGTKKVIEIKTKNGRKLAITPEHRIFVFSEKIGFEWIEARFLNKSHFLCITLPDDIELKYKTFDVKEYIGSKLYYYDQQICLDETMAELMGYMISEGSVNGTFSNFNSNLIHDFHDKWISIFGDKSCIIRTDGCNVGSHGGEILKSLGFICGSYNKEIPSWILQGKKSIVIAFLRGCYAGDGNFRNHHSTYASVSKKLAQNIQLLNTFIGVNCSLNCYKSGVNKSDTWVVRTSSGKETEKLFNFLNPIRKYSSYKNLKSNNSFGEYIIKNVFRLFEREIINSMDFSYENKLVFLGTIRNYFPWITKSYIKELAKLLKNKGLLLKKSYDIKNSYNMAYLHDIHKNMKTYYAEKIIKKLSIKKATKWKIHKEVLPPLIKKLYKVSNIRTNTLNLLSRSDIIFDAFDTIIDNNNTKNVYDLTVESSEQFTVNGIVVHNCKHLCSLAEFLQTKITSDAPKPDEHEPVAKPTPTLKKQPAITPEHPTTTDAPEPGDTYSDSRSGLNEGRGRLYEQIDSFVRSNPQFDVQVIDNSLNENTVVVSESHEHGEWWIDEYGGVEFADGDTGEKNHEAVVIERLSYEILSHFDIDESEANVTEYLDDIKKTLVDDGRLTANEERLWNDGGQIQIIIDKLLEDNAMGDKEQTKNAVHVVFNHNNRDARDYAMKYWRWKIMKTFNSNIEVQTWFLKPEDLTMIVKGIWEIMDNDTERDDDEDKEIGDDGLPGPRINVTVQAQGKRYSNIPFCVMEKRLPAEINAYRSGVQVGYNENLTEDFHHNHKEYRMFEANKHIIAIFEDNTRLKFEVHFRNMHGADRDKWRRRAFTTWKSLASKLHGDVTLSDVCNPIQRDWKDCFKEALKDPKMKAYIRKNPHHRVFEDKGYPSSVQGKAQPCVDPVNFTPR